MLDIKTQSQLFNSVAATMRSCFVATASAWAASASRGLAVWTELAKGGSQENPFGGAQWPAWTPCGWSQWPWLPNGNIYSAWAPRASTWPDAASLPCVEAASPTSEPAAPADYASYRSSGGHAAAQVVVAPVQAEKLAAAATAAPMYSLLDVWRSALHA